MSGDIGGSEMALIRKAIDVVGRNVPGDRSFHAAEFEKRHIAPLRCLLPDLMPLVRILEADPVRTAVAGYAEADEEARKEQKRYQRDVRATGWPLWLSVLIGIAVVLVPPAVLADAIGYVLGWGSDSHNDIILIWRTWAPWIVYGGLIGTAFQHLRFRPATHYLLWQQQRAKAEAFRREVFKRLLDHSPSEVPWELLLKLEYFRRWQVELQRDYFLDRGDEHARAVRRASLLSHLSVLVLLLLGLALLSSAVAGYDEQGMPNALLRGPLDVLSLLDFAEAWSWDYWLLLIGALTITAMAYYLVLDHLSACKRNAPRFETMRENFDELLGERLKEAREGAARGNLSAVRHYVDRVHAVMTLEINDWVRLADLDRGLDTALRVSADGTTRMVPPAHAAPQSVNEVFRSTSNPWKLTQAFMNGQQPKG